MRGSAQSACRAGDDGAGASGPRVRQLSYDFGVSQVEGASRTHYGHRTYFVGSEMRGLAASGQLDYVPFQYQEGTEKPSLKWIKAGPTWFRLSDGTAVDWIDDNTFKIPMIDKVLRRRP